MQPQTHRQLLRGIHGPLSIPCKAPLSGFSGRRTRSQSLTSSKEVFVPILQGGLDAFHTSHQAQVSKRIPRQFSRIRAVGEGGSFHAESRAEVRESWYDTFIEEKDEVPIGNIESSDEQALKPPPVTKQPVVHKGIKIDRALMAAAIGIAVYVAPYPAGLSAQSWTLFSVFCSTVAGLVLEPLPVGAWSVCCLSVLLCTGSVNFQTAMSGSKSESIWLIAIAFFFAKSFEKSGLGERIANLFVSALGSTTLGLSYGLAFAEALVAPALPSSTARAGGIFMPVIKLLSLSAGSRPEANRRKLGAFLVHVQCQASSQSSCLYVTGAAQNLLAMSIAADMGVVIPDLWVTWFKGAVVPSVLGLLMVPILVYALEPPGLKESPEAPGMAQERLQAMGPPSHQERITLAVLMLAVTLWVFGDQLKISAVATAMVALSTLLACGVLSWDDCLEYSAAWDTLLWFSILTSMCSALAEGGIIAAFADAARVFMNSLNMHWTGSFACLHIFYFTVHYIFASQVGHVGALYGAFLAMMLAAGVPTTLAALSLGYQSNLFGTITHYASGPATVYFASGYQKMKEVLKLGIILGLRSFLVWGVVGMAWWKFLGWW